jgi:cytochrome P450
MRRFSRPPTPSTFLEPTDSAGMFGGGAHRCLEALARRELEEGLAALTARIPPLQLSGEPPEIRGHVSVRRVGAMRVHWSIAELA